MTQSTLEALRSSALFKDLADDELQHLVSISREEEYPADHSIFEQHDEAKTVYMVVSGKVSLVICLPRVGCRQLMEVHDGDLIGWSALLDRPRMSDAARTLTPTKLIAFDGAKLLKLCREEPAFGFEFMFRTANVLAERLGATRIQLLDLHGDHFAESALESD